MSMKRLEPEPPTASRHEANDREEMSTEEFDGRQERQLLAKMASHHLYDEVQKEWCRLNPSQQQATIDTRGKGTFVPDGKDEVGGLEFPGVAFIPLRCARPISTTDDDIPDTPRHRR